MHTPRPPLNRVWEAISTYLDVAYGGQPPPAVLKRIDQLKQIPEQAFYESDLFEREDWAGNTRLFLRLGNRFYPNMKMAIEAAPDGADYFFRADTHDRHCCPDTNSPDYQKFSELMERNRQLAMEIETAWSNAHVPTFKSYLRSLKASRGSAGKT